MRSFHIETACFIGYSCLILWLLKYLETFVNGFSQTKSKPSSEKNREKKEKNKMPRLQDIFTLVCEHVESNGEQAHDIRKIHADHMNMLIMKHFKKTHYSCKRFEYLEENKEYSFMVGPGRASEKDIVEDTKKGQWNYLAIETYLNELYGAGIIPECELVIKT